MSDLTANDRQALRELLQRRLAIIADKALRESDPATQLTQLREVSEAITHWHQEHRSCIPARLHHFLTQASFDKALALLDE